MDILVGLIGAAITVGVIGAVAIGMAFLFIIVLALATGIDSNIHQEDERA